jgi:hypothetical protein
MSMDSYVIVIDHGGSIPPAPGEDRYLAITVHPTLIAAEIALAKTIAPEVDPDTLAELCDFLHDQTCPPPANWKTYTAGLLKRESGMVVRLFHCTSNGCSEELTPFERTQKQAA